VAKARCEGIGRFRGGNAFALAPLCLWLVLTGCSGGVNPGPTGTSVSGYEVAIRVIPSAIPADGSSQATVRVEVRDAFGNFVDGAAVTLTATLGTLGDSSLSTSGGVATTTFTAGSEEGTAHIVATVENVSVTGSVSLLATSG